MNIHVYLRELADLTQNPPLMVEHLAAEELPAAMAYILQVAEENGVAFYQPTESKEEIV